MAGDCVFQQGEGPGDWDSGMFQKRRGERQEAGLVGENRERVSWSAADDSAGRWAGLPR